MAEYLATNDQSADVDGDQFVHTSTIAFDLNDPQSVQLLRDAANLGQGTFYSADNIDELVTAFTNILIEVRSADTSFVSPSLATNAFNRLLSRDEIYFGLFTPALSQAWLGNVKKYSVCVDSTLGCSLGEILDAARVSATSVTAAENSSVPSRRMSCCKMIRAPDTALTEVTTLSSSSKRAGIR